MHCFALDYASQRATTLNTAHTLAMLPDMRTYYVYILASRSKALYIGVTKDLNRRVWEHKQKTKGHTSKYNITQLVYFEEYGDPMSAIRREKQIKAWRRESG